MKSINPVRVSELSRKIHTVITDVAAEHIGREEVLKVLFLSLISGKPAFLLGFPGGDKTGTIKAFAGRIAGARYYRALMPGVTNAEALFFPKTVIVKKMLTDGSEEMYPRGVLGRAAEAEIVFADEVFKTPDQVLNPMLDFANGDGVEQEGTMTKTPLRMMISASNELADPSSNLAAFWSRALLRCFVNPLSWDMKMQMVGATIGRQRGSTMGATISLAEVDEMIAMRHSVIVPDNVRQIVREICEQKLVSAHSDGVYDWLFQDDRRFKRLFDVLQAHALLAGRTEVSKADLTVLRWMLWDTPEQINEVEAVITPYVRTPMSEARELIDALLATGGNVHAAFTGNDASKAVAALRQCGELSRNELPRLKGQAGGAPDETQIQGWIDALTAFTAKLSGKIAGADVGSWIEAIDGLN